MGVKKVDKEGRETDALGPEGIHRNMGKNFKRCLERGQAQDRRCPCEVAIDALGRPKPDLEGEGFGMGEPSLKGLCRVGQQPRGDIYKGGSTWPTVQVLVPAADGKVDIECSDIDWHCACGVGEVPHHQCTIRVRGAGDSDNIKNVCRAVINVGCGDDCGVF